MTESEAAKVFYPLMPKGVEHTEFTLVFAAFWIVFYPLMPKGVEHKIDLSCASMYGSCFIR